MISKIPFNEFRDVLIKPLKYDDDGYVIRFWKRVLPSNTLNVLNGLTEKHRLSRRPGFNTDPLPVHLWKRSKEVIHLFISRVQFIKEMEEIWLQTGQKRENEERWLEEMVRIHASIRLRSRIQEWQEAYSRLHHSLSPKYLRLHAKFDFLSNRALYSRETLHGSGTKPWNS